MITLIAARALNGVIGNKNTIPWRLSEDFKHFSSTTREHVVVMGMNTWESLPKRPLPKRVNIVISRTKNIEQDGNVFLVRSIDEAISLATEEFPSKEIFIIGGESIYRQTIDLADRLIISEVDLNPEGDTVFPLVDEEWRVVEEDQREGFVIRTFEK